MADLKKSIKDEMNSTPSCIPAKWNRYTVADGDWMQAKTLDQLMNTKVIIRILMMKI